MTRIEHNSEGRRIGEGHPRACYTDAEVLVIQRLADAGILRRKISEALGVPYSTVRAITNGRMRCQTPVQWGES